MVGRTHLYGTYIGACLKLMEAVDIAYVLVDTNKHTRDFHTMNIV